MEGFALHTYRKLVLLMWTMPYNGCLKLTGCLCALHERTSTRFVCLAWLDVGCANGHTEVNQAHRLETLCDPVARSY